MFHEIMNLIITNSVKKLGFNEICSVKQQEKYKLGIINETPEPSFPSISTLHYPKRKNFKDYFSK